MALSQNIPLWCNLSPSKTFKYSCAFLDTFFFFSILLSVFYLQYNNTMFSNKPQQQYQQQGYGYPPPPQQGEFQFIYFWQWEIWSSLWLVCWLSYAYPAFQDITHHPHSKATTKGLLLSAETTAVWWDVLLVCLHAVLAKNVWISAAVNESKDLPPIHFVYSSELVARQRLFLYIFSVCIQVINTHPRTIVIHKKKKCRFNCFMFVFPLAIEFVWG